MKLKSFLAELKRRNVYKVAVAYATVGWLLFQIATSTLPVLKVPNWTTKLVIAFVLLGFPIAPLLAWALNSHRKGSSAQKMSISRPDAFQKPHMDPRRFDLDKRKDNWVQCVDQDLDLVRKLILGAPSLRGGFLADGS